MPRLRDHGIGIGRFEPGPLNAITDVPRVSIGHVTLIEGDRTRTGATAIIPHPGNIYRAPVPAGFAVLNGYGKFAGSTQVEELGELETPILLTNTLAVGRAMEALVRYTVSQPGNETVTTVNAVVGETNDSRLNDIRAPRPTVEEMGAALASAEPGAVVEGAVGAGTGTVAFGLKGGVGTASRLVPGYALGVLVQANFGGTLRIDGKVWAESPTADVDGSIVIIIATDAPLCARNLRRLSVRAFGGLARSGAALSNGSGDYALAFSVGEGDVLANQECSPLFEAVIECTEEAIVNALLAAGDMKGFDAGTGAASYFRGLTL